MPHSTILIEVLDAEEGGAIVAFTPSSSLPDEEATETSRRAMDEARYWIGAAPR